MKKPLYAIGIAALMTLAHARAQTYMALMNSGHMVPPGFASGTAQSLVTLTNNETQIAVDLTWSGMLGLVHGASVRGPAGPGTNAAVIFTVTMPMGESGTAPRQTFNVTPTQVSYLTNHLLYMQIDDALRGQLILPPPPPVFWSLTLVTNGPGSVVANPSGTSHTNGLNVSLTATAANNYVFAGWSGDASGTANPLNVTMNTNKSITANFHFLTNSVPATIELAARIGWLAENHKRYVVQGASIVDSNNWVTLSGVIFGTGATNYYSDPIGNNEKRFYRVITQP